MRPRIQVVVQEDHQVYAKLNLPNMFGRPRGGAAQAFEVPWPNVMPHISLGTLKSHVWNGQMLADCLYIELDEELELALDDLSTILWLWDNGLGEFVVRPVLPCNVQATGSLTCSSLAGSVWNVECRLVNQAFGPAFSHLAQFISAWPLMPLL